MRYSIVVFLLLSITILNISCGVKGSPKPPPTDKPLAITDIKIKQVGNFALVSFSYPKLYTDSRPIKEDIQFKIYRDLKEINVDISNRENIYWFFDKLLDKKHCYEIMVKTSKKVSQPSDKVCIIAKDIKNLQLNAPILENTDKGVLIKTNIDKTAILYKTHDTSEFSPIAYKEIKGILLDEEVSNNETVCYYYTLKIDNNIESDYSKTSCITYADTFPPAQPERGKLVVNNDGSATLIWQKSRSDDVVGYVIYKNSVPLVDIPFNTYYFTDRSYKDGDIYYIYAVDKAKNKSKPLEIK